MKMTRKNNKKGFTIVELVIVIAVIAILAAVLIPTFSGLVEKANASKALQQAENAMKNDLIIANGDLANMATPYTLLTEEPDDWSTNYTHYYTKSGDTYTAVTTANPAPTFANGTYYEKVVYAGTYTAASGNDSATWEMVQEKYTCTYTIANGEWAVVKTAD